MNIVVNRHLLFCGTSNSASCSNPKDAQTSWLRLKSLLKKFDLENPLRKEGVILRSKVDCLRVCSRGPILLIWPDGIWYGSITPEKLDIIVSQHLICGKPIKDWMIKITPLVACPINHSHI